MTGVAIHSTTWPPAERALDITASTAAALFGCHPYKTAFQLWAEKSGLVEEEALDPRLAKQGHLFEDDALELLADERPDWQVRAGESIYWRDPNFRLGATPDAYGRRPDVEGTGVVQIKTSGRFVFQRDGIEDGEIEPPAWIAIQVLLEAFLTGSTWAAIAVLTLGDGGPDLHVVDVPFKPRLIERLKELTADFWRRVETGEGYPPDYGRDGAAIARRYMREALDDATIDLSGNARMIELLDQREDFKLLEENGAFAERERKKLDAEILTLLGNASRGTLEDGRVIEAKTVRRKAYTVAASSYCAIRVKEA
jgi:predicted phage-related endonuclease